MDREQWKRVGQLYEEALQRPKELRAQFIDSSSGDLAVAAAVRRLLTDGSLMALPSLLAPGELLAGRYRIVQTVGRGGMGQVYEAFDEELGARVALKTIRPDLAREERTLVRFKQEVQLARQVSHPNVCRVYELVRTLHAGEDLFFLCMEYLEGETLSARLRARGPMPLSEAAPLLRQLTAGLSIAHAAGIVHRDLKSANIFLTEDREGAPRAVIADFGLAGSLVAASEAGTSGSGTSSSGSGIGTPAYMSPEQVTGEPVGPAADIYALGVVMYEMATGKTPFAGENALQIAVRRLKEKPRPVRDLNPAVDPKWAAVIDRCLELDPADRFASAGDVVPALSAGAPALRVRRRHWPRLLGAAAVLVGVAGGIWYGTRAPRLEASPQALSWLQRGIAHTYDANWPEAEAAFTQALRASPKLGIAAARRAEARLEMERMDDARSSLLEGAGTGTYTAEQKLYSDAVLAYLTRDIDRAIQLLRERIPLASEADSILARVDLARFLTAQRRWADALPVWQDVVTRDPGNRMAWLHLARAQSARNLGYQASLERARVEIERSPDPGLTKDLAFYRASIAVFKREPEALMVAQQAVDAAAVGPPDFRYFRAMFTLAEAYGQAKRPREAEAAYARLEQATAGRNLDLLVAKKYYDLGRLKSTQSQVEEANRLLRTSIDMAGRLGAQRTRVIGQLKLADNLLDFGSQDFVAEARRLAEESLGFSESQGMVDLKVDALLLRVRLAGLENNAADAERLTREALVVAAKSPDRRSLPDVQRRLSLTLIRQLALREAYDISSQLVGLDSAAARLQLARIRMLQGDYAQARQFALAVQSELEPLAQSLQLRRRCERFLTVLKSEMGESAEAHREIQQVIAAAEASRQPLEAEDARDVRCMIEAEWHRYDLAGATCGAVIGRLQGAGPTDTMMLSPQRSLAQAAYWGRDYTRAASLALDTYTRAGRRADRITEWSALLTLTASEGKLGRPIEARLKRIRQFTQIYAQQNGPEALPMFLARRPFREFLKEIDFVP